MTLTDSGVESLTQAIIIQACKDYVTARTLEVKGRLSIAVESTLYDCRRFFRGAWFESLTDLDGESLINGLDRLVDKEVNNGIRKNL